MMKNILYTAAAVAGMSMVLAGCSDNFTYPPLIFPETVAVEANIPMADFKTEYWSALSAPVTVPAGAAGDTLIFTGRVCSSDETGNIFKNIVVQSRDANGEQIAMTFAVNSYDLYQLFPYGQEVAVYASGLQIGGYRGLLQFGAVSGSEMTFMNLDTFKEHIVRNNSGMPDPSKVDTTATTIAELLAAKSDATSLMKWQSRLVRVEGVSFQDAGKEFAPDATVNRNIVDAAGNKMIVRNSSYASFKNDTLPYGTGDVTGILSYFGSDWQILLIDAAGVQNFDGVAPEPVKPQEPVGEGTLESPYNVAKALQIISAMSSSDSQEAVVKGIVTAISDIDTGQYGNATYTIADAIVGDGLGVYRGYGVNGAKFTATDQLQVGAEVVISGKLVNYYGNTPQFTTGSSIVSYTAPAAK